MPRRSRPASADTGQGYPYREALATHLDCSKQTVDRAGDYLEHEIGLVKTHRRKVEGKPDENDANLYEIFDAWLIHGVRPPAGTPPQLVARYGHTIPGLDVSAWVSENAPDFDLAAWQAAYDEKLRAQQAQREEQRCKERARRKKPKKGGGVMGDATPEGAEREGVASWMT
jgi:DNA-binding transcriptional MocR family regulator